MWTLIWSTWAATLSRVMSDKQIRTHFKHCQIITHVETAWESHDLNMDFRSFWQWFQTDLRNTFYARISLYLIHRMSPLSVGGFLLVFQLWSAVVGSDHPPHRRHSQLSTSLSPINHKRSALTLCITGNFSCFVVVCWYFQNQFFRKIPLRIPSECQINGVYKVHLPIILKRGSGSI